MWQIPPESTEFRSVWRVDGSVDTFRFNLDPLNSFRGGAAVGVQNPCPLASGRRTSNDKQQNHAL